MMLTLHILCIYGRVKYFKIEWKFFSFSVFPEVSENENLYILYGSHIMCQCTQVRYKMLKYTWTFYNLTHHTKCNFFTEKVTALCVMVSMFLWWMYLPLLIAALVTGLAFSSEGGPKFTKSWHQKIATLLFQWQKLTTPTPPIHCTPQRG